MMEMEKILLGKVIKYKKGVKPKYLVEQEIENGIPYLTAKYFRQNKPEAYTKDIKGNKFVKANIDDVILIWDGSNAGDVFKGLAGALASTMVKFEKSEQFLDDFLYFFLKTKFTLLNSKTTGSTIPHVNKNILDNLELPLIPLPEQRKIAYVLSTVQKAIEQQDKLIRHTTELKKALMQKLFTEGLPMTDRGVRFSNPEGSTTRKLKQTEIGLVPESWEVVELGDICERISINVQPNPNGEKPYVGLEHIIPGQIYLTNWERENEVVSSKSAFRKGEILYGKLRPYLDKAVIAPFDGISSTDILIFTGRNDVENDFLIHFFHTDRLIDFAKSTTSGVQHPRTSWSSLKKLKLGLPSKAERRFIAKSLNLLENKLLFHQKKKQTLTDLFKTLLHELMTGKRRVHEIEFEAINTKVQEMSTSI